MGVYSGNRTLLGESIYSDGYSHVMDMVLENERNDLNMFNAVINCDFVEAFSEAGITYLSEEQKDSTKEESKKSIGEKIKELFNKAIASVQNFISAFIAKIKNLIANDAKLYKTYEKNFKENGVGYKISSGWIPLTKGAGTSSDTYSEDFKKVMAKYASTLAAIDKMTDSAEISDAVNSAKKVFKECDFYAVNDLYFGERDRKDSSHTLTSDEVRQILEVMKSSTKPIDQIKRIGKNEIANLKQKQKDLKFQKQLQSDNAEAVAQINGKYKLASAYITAQSKNLNAHCNAYARYLAACRRAFVLAGKKAAASEEKSTEEAAMFDFVLGEASNDYVEAMLLG